MRSMGWMWIFVAWAPINADETAKPADQAVEKAHFHHVRLNVTDPAATMKFYQQHFGATKVKYRGQVDALFTERSFLLLNPVDDAPPAALRSAIWHIGWGGVDVPNEFKWFEKKGVPIHTPLSPIMFDNYYMYLLGPDKELIEVNTMGHHRFGHVHFFADDVNQAAAWYDQHLGLAPRNRNVPKPKGDPNSIWGIWMSLIEVDNVIMIFFATPDQDPPPRWWPDAPLREMEPTKGRPIDHIAFSYRRIDPVFERMKEQGVEIVQPIAVDERFGHRSFYVMAPHQVLVEIVEDKPIPEGIWDE